MTITPLVRPPLSTLAEYPDLGDSVLFQLNGLVVVFVALSSIWGVMELMGLFFRRRKAVAPPPAAEKPAGAAAPGGPGPELTAVIAAAVCSTLGERCRIFAITPDTGSLDWAREGRREIFASHRHR
jgi:sodium pump decarboxylase gamma subunit